jgi:phosphinothricin acetyltransferase
LGDIIEIGCELVQFGTTSVTISCEVRNKDTKQTIIKIDKIVFVAVDENDQVVGFGALSEYRDRAAYSTSVENSVYVRRDFGRRGIGKLLLNSLLDHATAAGFHVVMARIEASGLASRELHAACGFQLVGIEREIGRKFGKWLDVAIMQCVLHER